MLNGGKITSEEVIRDIEFQVNPLTHTIILSAEDFCLVQDASFFSRLRERYDVSAVVYLKRQDLWLESWYNQHVKWPWDEKFSSSTPDEFLRRHDKDFSWIDYYKLVKDIERRVGLGNLYVNVVDESGVKDTVGDFLNHLSIDPMWLNDYSDKNSSLSSAKLDILRRVDTYGLSGKARQRVIEALGSMEIEEDNGSKLVFDDSQVKRILSCYDESNRKVAREYFSRDRLFYDEVKLGRQPVFVSDERAYKYYIPQILKVLSDS
ncbi:hypothetical protein [Halomonas sp. I1]|uniref:hypothetical protein n=1 Tax=Halomonas sp. I1 TaxID=393536 RepID=UPI0028E39B3B|nr:hypothetical protein [Halomonas sp. I1]